MMIHQRAESVVSACSHTSKLFQSHETRSVLYNTSLGANKREQLHPGQTCAMLTTGLVQRKRQIKNRQRPLVTMGLAQCFKRIQLAGPAGISASGNSVFRVHCVHDPATLSVRVELCVVSSASFWIHRAVNG